MGIFDILDKDKRATRKIEKSIKKLTNPYVQSEERMQCAELLRDAGTDESIYGLLRRFTVRASNAVVDEEEKQQVFAMVVDLGEAAVGPILKFCRRESQLLHPLRALEEIEAGERLVEHLGEILEYLGPDYMKDPEPKLHLVQQLGGTDHPRVVPLLLPFLDDHDETVRFQVIQAIAQRGGDGVNEGLLGRLLTDEDESLRIHRAVAEALSKAQFSVGEARREAVAGALPEVWRVDEQGRIQKRK